MENLWTSINDDIPIYFKTICEEYGLTGIKLSPIKTALVGKVYTLIVEIDRFGIDLVYVYKGEKGFEAYECGSYFAARYDEVDRQNLLEGSGADIIVRNSIIITVNGLINKCRDILGGDVKWMNKYKESSRYSKIKISEDETKIITKWTALKNDSPT